MSTPPNLCEGFELAFSAVTDRLTKKARIASGSQYELS